MIVRLLTEHHLEFLSIKEAAEARLSLHMSKCHIVGNLMHWLIIIQFSRDLSTQLTDKLLRLRQACDSRVSTEPSLLANIVCM